MGLLDGAKQAFLKALRDENPTIPAEDMDRLLSQLEEQLANEPPPRIALIGETGVGKSSTLNALFNAGQTVSHTEACTQEAAEIRVPLGSIFVDRMHVDSVEVAAGDLIVFDMPGLNESLESRSHHLGVYEDVLSQVDVALWILDGSNRAMGAIQDEIRKLDPRLTQRMVFALNKVDAIFPETEWIDVANLPSEAQEANINRRIADVESKVRAVLPDWSGAVIGYSAARRYKLPQLFAAMLDSVSRERRWVVTERKDLADFLELVDPRFLPDDVAQRRADEAARRAAEAPQVRETAAERRHRLLTSLSPEEFSRVASSPEALADWLSEVDVPERAMRPMQPSPERPESRELESQEPSEPEWQKSEPESLETATDATKVGPE